MQITSLPYRTALVQTLDTHILYQSTSIRVWEEFVSETETKRIVTLNNGCQAYIILLNQTSNEARSNKCNRNNNDSIQIQITTVWPAGKGGSKTAEEIAQVILNLLFSSNIKNTDLALSNGLSMWKSELLSSRNINYDGDSSRTWITQLILESWISQS
jgi:hypothetical protein